MRPHNDKNNIITVDSVAVVFVVIIIITLGNKTPKRSTYLRSPPVQFFSQTLAM